MQVTLAAQRSEDLDAAVSGVANHGSVYHLAGDGVVAGAGYEIGGDAAGGGLSDHGVGST